jgi:predicted nucleic acid-binding protein
MNLYTDTSALVKKYIQEAGSEQVISYFETYPIIGTAALTLPEIAAALAKAIRLGWVPEAETRQAWQDFLSHWPTYTRLPVSTGIIERGAYLTWRYGLRAYDAVHLASALSWKEMIGQDVVFACFDKNLNKAAQQEGLQIWPDEP